MAETPLPWWERWAGRLDHELAALRSAGIEHEVDEAARCGGTLQVRATVDIDGEAITVLAVFPDSYPYFRFEVIAPDIALPHHQNPVSKNVCLINRGSENWHVDDTLAGFLTERLPQAVRTGRSTDPTEVAGIEAAQPEPRVSFYPYAPGSAVIVDTSWAPQQRCGTLAIGLDGANGEMIHGTTGPEGR